MGLNTNVFQEPRGVMRVLQFIFAICAFATTVNFTNEITLDYCTKENPMKETFTIEYPFELDAMDIKIPQCESGNKTDEKPSTLDFYLPGDFSSDAQFFVATGVLSMLYTLGISVVYLMFDNSYQQNALVPMADFLLTVLLAVFWLSGSAAWANGLDGLKGITDPDTVRDLSSCKTLICSAVGIGSYSSLNISVILGFLNFFLWASDLWFLYKETQWFKNANPAAPASSPGISAA